MDELFQSSAFHLRPIPPGGEAEGFVFTPFDAGTKVVRICLHSAGSTLSRAMAAGAAKSAATVRRRESLCRREPMRTTRKSACEPIAC